jgi:hypothetical protein
VDKSSGFFAPADPGRKRRRDPPMLCLIMLCLIIQSGRRAWEQRPVGEAPKRSFTPVKRSFTPVKQAAWRPGRSERPKALPLRWTCSWRAHRRCSGRRRAAAEPRADPNMHLSDRAWITATPSLDHLPHTHVRRRLIHVPASPFGDCRVPSAAALRAQPCEGRPSRACRSERAGAGLRVQLGETH